MDKTSFQQKMGLSRAFSRIRIVGVTRVKTVHSFTQCISFFKGGAQMEKKRNHHYAAKELWFGSGVFVRGRGVPRSFMNFVYVARFWTLLVSGYVQTFML